MKAAATLFIAMTLVLCAASIVGCDDDDDERTTCQKLDKYIDDCYPTCASGFECSTGYADASPVAQADLDWCADCLDGLRYCDDWATCQQGGDSCRDLLVDYLDLTCSF